MLGRAAPLILLLGAVLGSACITFSGPDAGDESHKPYTTIVVANVTGVSKDRPSTSEFYHLQVWGNERAVHLRGPTLPSTVCSRAWQFTTNRSTEGVSYHESLRPTVNVSRLGTLFTFNVWGVQFYDDRMSEGCPTIYEIRGYSTGSIATVNRTMGAYGSIEVTVFPEGLFAFGETHFVDLGKKLIVSYGRIEETDGGAYFVQGGFEVANLGAWPRDRLVSASSGTITKGPG